MKKPLPIFTLLFSVLLFAGCDKSEDPVADPNAAPVQAPDGTNNLATAKALVLRMNQDSITNEIVEFDLSTGSMKLIGSAPQDPMAFSNDLSKLHYDKKNNQLVAFYKGKGLWMFNLTSKTYKTVDLPELPYGFSYQHLLTIKDKTLIVKWNQDNFTSEIHEVDVSNGSLKLLGASSSGVMSSVLELRRIKYDEQNNKLVGLLENQRSSDLGTLWGIWTFDLASRTDKEVGLPTPTDKDDTYKDVLPIRGKTIVLKWNDYNTTFEIQELDVSNGSLKLIGAARRNMFLSSFDLYKIHYEEGTNQIVGLVGNMYVWTFDLTKKTDGRVFLPIEFPRRFSYMDLLIPGQQ